MSADWPTGWRSARGMPRLWVPLVAIVVGLLLPALVAFGLLSVAGLPGVLDAEGPVLRRGILLVLYALFASPVPGWLLLPLIWPALLMLARFGWAGGLSVTGAACLVGLTAAHLVLHADLTLESPDVIPPLIVAFSIQGIVVWAGFWLLDRRFPARSKAG